MAFQIRRGTNQQRLGITLVEGEIVYVTDSELRTLTVSSINITTDVLSTDIEHGLVLNQQLRYLGLSQMGLVSNQVYFVKTTPLTTTFTLSATLNGGTVNITGVTGAVDLQFAVSPTDLLGAPVDSSVSPLWVGDGVTVGGVPGGTSNLSDLSDVEIGPYGPVLQYGEVLKGQNVLQYNALTNKWENTSDLYLTSATIPAQFERRVTLADIDTGFESKTSMRLMHRVTDAANNATDSAGGSIMYVRSSGVTGGAETQYAQIAADYFGTTNTMRYSFRYSSDNFTETTPGVFPNTFNLLNIGTTTANFLNNSLFVDYTGRVGINTNSLTAGAGLDVNAAALVRQTLQVTGAVTANGNINTNQINSISGNLIFVPQSGTVEITGNSTVSGNSTVTGDLALNGGDLTTTSSVGNLFNTNATTVNIGNAATTAVNLGAASAGRVQIKSPLLETLGNVLVAGDTDLSGGLIVNAGVLRVDPVNNRVGIMISNPTKTLDVIGDGRLVGNLEISLDLEVNGGDITTTAGTGNIFNTAAAVVNIGNAATTEVNLGAPAAGRVQIKSATLQVNSGVISSTSGVASLYNIGVPEINIGSDATTAVRLGSVAGGITQVKSPILQADGDVAVNGGDLTTTSNIGNLFNTVATVVNVGNAATSEVNLGAAGAGRVLIKSALFETLGEALIAGNLTVNGDLTYLNVQDLQVEDKNIILARGNTTDAGANLGGITLKGTTDKTINWDTALNGWVASDGLYSPNIVALTSIGTNGGEFYFNNDDGTPGSGDNASIIVKRGAGADVVFRWNESLDRWQSTTDGSTYRTLPNQDLDTGNSPEFAGATLGNVRVGITGDNEIDTSTGNLTIDSAGGTTTIDDAVVITGGLAVDTNTLVVDAATNQVSIAGTAAVGSALTVTGSASVSADLSAGSVTIDGRSTTDTGTATTILTTEFQLDSTSRNSVKLLVNILDNLTSERHTVEILALRKNSTEAVFTTYAELYTGAAPLATFSANVQSGNLRIMATPATVNNTVFTFVRTTLT